MKNEFEIENLFLPFNLAKRLKKLKFEWQCFGVWENNTFAPPAKLHINYTNKPFEPKDDKEKELYEKRPGMFVSETKNSDLVEWLIAAPTIEQVLLWLEEKHEAHIDILTDCTLEAKYCYEIHRLTAAGWAYGKTSDLYYTRKEAQIDAIIEVLKEIKPLA